MGCRWLRVSGLLARLISLSRQECILSYGEPEPLDSRVLFLSDMFMLLSRTLLSNVAVSPRRLVTNINFDRFERTSCAQKNGFKNREKWEKDSEDAKKNPYATVQSIGRWLSEHDPEQYVYANWQACLNHMTSGAPFKNTNLPPGYEYEPWTMEGLMKMSQNGQLAPDPGEWN